MGGDDEVMNDSRKSDNSIVPEKPANKEGKTPAGEGKGVDQGKQHEICCKPHTGAGNRHSYYDAYFF